MFSYINWLKCKSVVEKQFCLCLLNYWADKVQVLSSLTPWFTSHLLMLLNQLYLWNRCSLVLSGILQTWALAQESRKARKSLTSSFPISSISQGLFVKIFLKSIIVSSTFVASLKALHYNMSDVLVSFHFHLFQLICFLQLLLFMFILLLSLATAFFQL